MKVEVSIGELTWGEFRAFVALGVDVPADEPVEIARDYNTFEPVGLVLGYVDTDRFGG